MACFGKRGKGVARKMSSKLRGVPRRVAEDQIRTRLDEQWAEAILARDTGPKVAKSAAAWD